MNVSENVEIRSAGPSDREPHSSRVRQAAAVCMLCAVGMLVGTALFASPAQRTAYRHAAAPVYEAAYPLPASGHASPRTIQANGHVVKDPRHC